ncbi:hypothetical protein [Providencia manganoxydans]|uniref:hypothetical protein n=1 Tax=Providencia manganoxydans TaxID=2923283 RepID=UPI0032D9DB6C
MEMKESSNDYTPVHYTHTAFEGEYRLGEIGSSDYDFEKMNSPSFTIFVTPPKSGFIDINEQDSEESTSTFGHVFIGITGYNRGSQRYESVSIGFSPGESITTSSDNLSFNDHLRYPDASTLTILGRGGAFDNDLNNLFDIFNQFKSGDIDIEDYDLISNNCVDFVRKFLDKAGVRGVRISGTPKGLLKRLLELASDYRTPIIIDMNGDGVNTLSKNYGVAFDFDGDGKLENTGWVDKHDALLVIDKNGDGIINNGSELFGENSIKRDGSVAIDGFDALSDYDDDNNDLIDANDQIWGSLKVWQDSNSDGVSQNEELLSLNDVGITSIGLITEISDYVDGNSNQHKIRSNVNWNDNRKTDTVDVWFEQANKTHHSDELINLISSINAIKQGCLSSINNIDKTVSYSLFDIFSPHNI